jgi:hypothetical protein
MRRARYLLVATLLATAVCADRAMAATPALRPEVTELAERFVNRLSVSFRRVVPAIRMVAERQQGGVFAAGRSLPLSWTEPVHPQPVSPFQFRLPPPTA